MGMKCCPTCNRKMMDTFTVCPWCNTNFLETEIKSSETEDISNSIIEYHEGKKTELTTNNGNSFLFELSDNWDLSDRRQFLSADQKDHLYEMLSNIDFIKRVSPSLYDIIVTMSKKDNVLIAKLDQYTKKLVDEGELWFSVDKNGELLPTVRNKKGIVKQVRLENWTTPNNGFSAPLTNIYTQMALTQILNEVTSLRSSISSLKTDLQQDRLAKADHAISLYKQAIACTTARKDELLKESGKAATEAKTTLMRNLEVRLNYITTNVDKSWIEKLLDSEGDTELVRSSNDAVNDLVGILQMLDIECTVHRYYGEEKAIDTCLQEYISFVQANHLDQRDTIIKITECLPQKLNGFVSSYSKLTSNIFLYHKNNLVEQKELNNKRLTSLTSQSSLKLCANCERELPSDSQSTNCEYCSRKNNKTIRTTGSAAVKTLSIIGGIGGAGVTAMSIGKKFS